MNTPVDIQIPCIQKELDAIAKGILEKKQVKASLFNLVIYAHEYAHEPKRIRYFQELVDTILGKFPCRILFINACESDKEYFHVSVASVISGSGAATVACDQISIKASKNQLFRVPHIIIPYLLPDLPVFLLWAQSPFEEHIIFPSLQPYASRVIFDSGCSDNLTLFCKEMEMNLNKLKMEVMDINWALLSNWRDLLYKVFETKEKVEELAKCKSVIITYNDNKTEFVQHPEIRSIYLQGWLASRFKWRYRQIERFQDSAIISYFAESNPVVMALQPCTDPYQPSGSILSIEITLLTGRTYSIFRKSGLPQAVVHESSPDTCELPCTLPLPNVHKGVPFISEILYQNIGEHYLEMLHMISQIDCKILAGYR
jgi:hypothetical protein